MSLTPQDIQSQQFSTRFRGFDVDEVDEFLERVADEMLNLIQENKQHRERIAALEGELASYRDQEKSFQKAILSAQRIADEMEAKAQEEARNLVEQAERQARDLIQQAHDEIAALERRVEELRAEKETVRAELRTMLQAYLARLDQEPEVQETVATTTPPPAGPAEEGITYEKIDLPEADFRFADDETGHEEPAEDSEDEGPMDLAAITAAAADDEEEADLPDLEGEMLFNLEDPLDDLTPDITIKDEEEDERR